MLETLREMVIDTPEYYLAWGGFLIATVFGYIVYVTNFCTMGSISDIMSFGDKRRFRVVSKPQGLRPTRSTTTCCCRPFFRMSSQTITT